MEFRHYIGTMRQSYYMMKDFTKFSSIYQKNPFSIKEEKEDVEIHRRIEESCKFDKFIKENWNKWCLKDICDENNNKNDGKLEFAIILCFSILQLVVMGID